MKKLLAVLLAVAMLMSMAVVASAENTYATPVELGLFVGGWGADDAVTVSEPGVYNLSWEGDAKSFDWLIVKNTAGESEPTSIPEGTVISITELKIDGTAYTFDGGNTSFDYNVASEGKIEIKPWLNPAFGGADHIDSNPKSASKVEVTLAVDVANMTPEVPDGSKIETSIGTLDGVSTELELLPLTKVLKAGDSVVLHFVGTTTGGFRYWVSAGAWSNCSAITTVTDTEFDVLTEIAITNDGADSVQFKGPSYGVSLDNLTLTYVGVFYGTMAEYEAALNPDFKVSVTGGTASAATAKAGASITVTADEAPRLQEFDKWIAEGIALADPTSPTVTFEMPESDVSLTATYKAIKFGPKVEVVYENAEGETFKEDGTLDPWGGFGIGVPVNDNVVDGISFEKFKEYAGMGGVKMVIDFTANGLASWGGPAMEAQFNAWDTEADLQVAPELTDLGNGKYRTTLDLDDAVAKLEAKGLSLEEARNFAIQLWVDGFKLNKVTFLVPDATEFIVNVIDGTATPATGRAGTTVTITANEAPEGKIFSKWVVLEGNVVLAKATDATTTFDLGYGDVVVKAVYRNPNDDTTHFRGGYVVMGDKYHALIGRGIIITTEHVFDETNTCVLCGHYVEPVEDEIIIEVTDPVEPSTDEEEDVTVDVEEPADEPAEEENPKTGLALAIIPMIVAAAAVVISKR